MGKGFIGTFKSLLGFQEPTLADVMSDAQTALLKSVTDVIDSDADRVAKTEAVRKLFADYEEHLAGAVPEAVEKALADAGFNAADLSNPGDDVRKESDMADERREDDEKEEKAREVSEEKARHAEPDGDEGEPDGDEEKARKAREEPEEKARGMKDSSDIDKRLAEAIAKRDAEVAEIRKANDELRKQMETLLAQSNAVEFAKRATDLGMPAAYGETIRKAMSGPADVTKAVEDILQKFASALRVADTSVVFKEFGGNGNGVSHDPLDQITAKAAELQKSDPKLTKEQAFAKAYEANPDLAIAERRANRPAA